MQKTLTTGTVPSGQDWSVIRTGAGKREALRFGDRSSETGGCWSETWLVISDMRERKKAQSGKRKAENYADAFFFVFRPIDVRMARSSRLSAKTSELPIVSRCSDSVTSSSQNSVSAASFVEMLTL